MPTTDLLAWSYTRQTRFAIHATPKMEELTKRYQGRLYGPADYDPLHIRPSLHRR